MLFLTSILGGTVKINTVIADGFGKQNTLVFECYKIHIVAFFRINGGKDGFLGRVTYRARGKPFFFESIVGRVDGFYRLAWCADIKLAFAAQAVGGR